MAKFLTLGYWFNMRPEGLHYSASIIYGALIILFLIIIVAFHIFRKRKKSAYFKVFRSLNSFAISNQILALLIWFMQYEEVYIFSGRFWLIIWGLSMLIWLYFIFASYRLIPGRLAEFKKEQEYRKYIP